MQTTPADPATNVPVTPPSSAWRRAWEAWKALAHRLGRAQAWFLLTLAYYVLMGPLWLIFTAFGGSRRESHWHARTTAQPVPRERYLEQY